MPQEKNPETKVSRKEYAEYMGQIIVKSNRYLMTMVAPVLLGAWLGHTLDKKMSWDSLGLVAGAMLGFIISIFSLLNKIKEENKTKKDV